MTNENKKLAYTLKLNNKYLSSIFAFNGAGYEFEASKLYDAIVYSDFNAAVVVALEVDAKLGYCADVELVHLYKPDAPFGDWSVLP